MRSIVYEICLMAMQPPKSYKMISVSWPYKTIIKGKKSCRLSQKFCGINAQLVRPIEQGGLFYE